MSLSVFKFVSREARRTFLFILSATRHYGGGVKRNVFELCGLFYGFINGKDLLKNNGLLKKKWTS